MIEKANFPSSGQPTKQIWIGFYYFTELNVCICWYLRPEILGVGFKIQRTESIIFGLLLAWLLAHGSKFEYQLDDAASSNKACQRFSVIEKFVIHGWSGF
jgi:hypothetical protein